MHLDLSAHNVMVQAAAGGSHGGGGEDTVAVDVLAAVEFGESIRCLPGSATVRFRGVVGPDDYIAPGAWRD